MTRPTRPPDTTEPEDAELEERAFAALARAVPSVAPPASLRDRVLARLRDEAAQAPRDLLTLRAGARDWQRVTPRVELRVLFVDPVARTRSLLARLAPGGEIPPHAHGVAEECLVLEGDLRIGDLELGPGDYHLAPVGTRHPSITTRGGAVVYLRQGVDEPGAR